MTSNGNQITNFLKGIASRSSELGSMLFDYERLCSCLVSDLHSSVDKDLFDHIMHSFTNLPSSQEIDSARHQLEDYAEIIKVFSCGCTDMDRNSIAEINWVLMRILNNINVAGFSAWINMVRKAGKVSELTALNYESFKNRWNDSIERLAAISESMGVKFPRISMFLPELEMITEDFRNWLSETYNEVFELLKPRLGEQVCSKLLLCLAYAESSYPNFLELVFFPSDKHGIEVVNLSDKDYSNLVVRGKILRTICAFSLRQGVPQEVDLENEATLVRQILSQKFKNEQTLGGLQKELGKKLDDLMLSEIHNLLGVINDKFAHNQFADCLRTTHEFFTQVIAAGLEYRKEKGLLLYGETFERYFDVVSAGFHKEVPEHLRRAGLSMKDWTNFLVYDTCWESLRYLVFCEKEPIPLSLRDDLVGQALGNLSHLTKETLVMPTTPAVVCHISKYFHPIPLLGSSIIQTKSGLGIVWTPETKYGHIVPDSQSPESHNSASIRNSEVETLYKRGESLARRSYHKEAIEYFKMILQLRPDHLRTLHAKGLSHLYLREHEQAVACFERLIEKESGHSEAWAHKGFALFMLNRFDDALNSYDEAIKRDPYISDYWVKKGQILRSLGRFEDALKAISKAVLCDPDSLFNWYFKGFVLGKLGRWEEAEYCYDIMFIIAPPDNENPQKTKKLLCSAAQNLSEILQTLGKYDEGYSAAKNALNLSEGSKNEVIPRFLMISALMLKKDTKKATAELKELSKILASLQTNTWCGDWEFSTLLPTIEGKLDACQSETLLSLIRVLKGETKLGDFRM